MESDYENIDNKILNEKFVSLFRSGYISVKGTTLPERFKDFYEAIANFEVYEDDIWICSFPKTGTTWTQEMIWMIMTNFDFKEATKSLLERFPFLDFSFLFDYRRVWEKYPEFNPENYLVDSLKYIRELKRPRYIKTHLPWHLLPKQIQNGTKRPKIIYVTRNPKDVCVSYYHHCKYIEGYEGEFDDFCNLFLEGKLTFGPFWANVSQYWERRNQPNVFFIKYEDLKKDLTACIKEMTKFLGKNLNEDQVEFLTKHLSFNSMKTNKAVNYDDFFALHKKYKLIVHDGKFIRSGNVNGYKSEIPEELISKLDVWMEEQPHSRELGYR